jgi:hypothetical protein
LFCRSSTAAAQGFPRLGDLIFALVALQGVFVDSESYSCWELQERFKDWSVDDVVVCSDVCWVAIGKRMVANLGFEFVPQLVRHLFVMHRSAYLCRNRIPLAIETQTSHLSEALLAFLLADLELLLVAAAAQLVGLIKVFCLGVGVTVLGNPMGRHGEW